MRGVEAPEVPAGRVLYTVDVCEVSGYAVTDGAQLLIAIDRHGPSNRR